jgi:multisubunit Na+/H+ antiporter MnhG subunit
MLIGDRIAIANYGTTAILMFVGFIAAIRVMSKLRGDANRLTLGIALVSLGIFLHQTFWFSRWLLKGKQDPATQWFLDNSWMLTGVYVLIDIGAVLIAYALFRDNCFFTRKFEQLERDKYNHGVLIWTILIVSIWTWFFIYTGV